MRIEMEFWVPEDFSVPEHNVTMEWVTERLGVSRRVVDILIREGLLHPLREGASISFDPPTVRRLAFILVLKRDMGVNLAGIEVILNMKSQLHWYAGRFQAGEYSPSDPVGEGISCWDID
jgi:MerR family transcriptional regulator/heat shock protein HspR